MEELPLKEIIRAITNNGLLNIKKLRDYAFPENEAKYQTIAQKDWVQTWSRLGPLIALPYLILFLLIPIRIGIRIEMDPFFYFFFILFHVLASIEALFCVAALLIFARIIKNKERNPAFLLALTPVFLFRRLPFFCAVYLFMAIFYKGLLSDLGQSRQVRIAYEEATGEKSAPPEEFWGFIPGQDSYDEVLKILKNAGAEFQITGYKESQQLSVIDITSYQALSQLGPLDLILTHKSKI